jgi:hypothetical protein
MGPGCDAAVVMKSPQRFHRVCKARCFRRTLVAAVENESIPANRLVPRLATTAIADK